MNPSQVTAHIIVPTCKSIYHIINRIVIILGPRERVYENLGNMRNILISIESGRFGGGNIRLWCAALVCFVKIGFPVSYEYTKDSVAIKWFIISPYILWWHHK